jgi:hypothetical protein
VRARGIRESIGLLCTGSLLVSCPVADSASEAAGAATQPTPTPVATTAPENEAREPKASEGPKIAGCAEWKESDAGTRSSFLRSRAVAYTEGRQEDEGEIVRACVDGRSAVCIGRIDKICRKKSSGDLEGVVEDCLDDCEIANYGKFYYHLVMGGAPGRKPPEKKKN